MAAKKILIQGARLLTCDPQDRVLDADVRIEDGRIAAITPHAGSALPFQGETIDGRGQFLLPGFIQTHVHFCQTLFRGAADDLALIDWLRNRIWPLEAAHTPESLDLSARLSIAELIAGGTTTALTMETVHHTEVVFAAVAETGFRAIIGKCLMDQKGETPDGLYQETSAALDEATSLIDRWHGRENERIQACLAPRFALSCTRELLRQTAELARQRGVLIHTHASENRDEIAMVEAGTGLRNLSYLDSLHLTGPDVVLAHCVHLDEGERQILRHTGTHVAHCPSSNLKLGSGIADIVTLRAAGINVTLGADGAPCNNRLDMFTEMRTAALLPKPLHGPSALPARELIRMATIGGARALGLDHEIGSIEIGKQADLQLIDLDHCATTPHPDPCSTLVYAASPANVRTVIIDGQIVMRDRQLLTLRIGDLLQAALRWSNRGL
ncbi:MAG: 5'-deoxyadenosine deaminase [Blastocatellia bacterium]